MARYNKEDIRRYIAYVAPLIRAEATKRGYPICSTVIAQSIIEGAAGTSSLARNYHNHFGLKCGSSWKGKSVNLSTKEEYTVGTLTTIKDNFRVYDNDIEGVKGYYDFIATKRYANLRLATDYKMYAEMLKADGYATSSKYVSTLCNTVQNYGLIQYDQFVVVSDEYYPMYEGSSNSIVMALEAVGVDPSRKNRAKIYAANFSDKYTYTAAQNTKMLDLLKQGHLKKT